MVRHERIRIASSISVKANDDHDVNDEEINQNSYGGGKH